MTPNLPTVSIITAVHNGARTLPAYFSALLSQTYPHHELIIIDGGSSDGSVEIIRQYEAQIHYWVSEADGGIYDAWNKGLEQASGEWIAFVGCDDQYCHQTSLERLVKVALATPGAAFVSARAKMLDSCGRLIRERGGAWNWFNFKWRLQDHIVHQGALHHRHLFERYGHFDLNYQIAADYEFLLRAGPTLKTAFLSEAILNCGYGASSQKPYRAYREVFTIQRRSPYVTVPEALLAYVIGLTKFHAGRVKHGWRHSRLSIKAT